MMRARRSLCGVVASGLLLGCGSSGPSPLADEQIGQAREALSVCDEVVPADRYIDGFPAYAQCPTSQNASIYSNNGIDTAVASQGTDWVRTQSSGGYQCTELAHRYLHFKWNVTFVPRGNAGTWCDTAPPSDSGVLQTTTPVHGDIMVLAPGSCGADATAGHVAVVDTIDTVKGRLSAVQQNGASRSNYQLTCAHCYLHVVANDGSVSPGGSGGAAGAGGTPAGTGGAVASGGAATGTGGSGIGNGGVTASGGVASIPAAGGSGGPGGGSGAPSGNSSGGSPTVSGAGGTSAVGAGEPQQTADTSSSSDDGSCTVARAGGGARGAWHPLALSAFALLVHRRRRLRRRQPGPCARCVSAAS